ncbi:MAG: hypothetical protein AB7U73_07110 [Pirellulales bacterium]
MLAFLLAQAAPPEDKPLIWRLDPVLRAKVLMALLGLILLGLLLIVLVRTWARWARRQARRTMRPTQPGDDRWYKTPLAPEERPPTTPTRGEPPCDAGGDGAG